MAMPQAINGPEIKDGRSETKTGVLQRLRCRTIREGLLTFALLITRVQQNVNGAGFGLRPKFDDSFGLNLKNAQNAENIQT